MKVLINGGGIAGNALAYYLSRLGHNITVIERFPGLRATGLQLDLRGPGLTVMRRMGLESTLRKYSAPEEGMQVVDSSGRRRAFFPANTSGTGKQSLTSEFEIMRGDLCRVLYESAMESDIKPEYVFGTQMESFEQRGHLVHVVFENGHSEDFDLVVGADGQWSRTRRLMRDTPDGLQLLSDVYIAYYTMNRAMAKDEKFASTIYMVPNGRGLMTRRHDPDKLQVMLTARISKTALKTVPRGNVDEEKAAMADLYRGAGWISADLVKGMLASDDFYCERPGLVKKKAWSQGRVTLVGDAAWCPTVFTGMGTTTAMIGAYILAGEIARQTQDGSRLEAALARYEEKFRPFMAAVQEGVADKGAKQMMPESKLGIAALNWGLGLASMLGLNIAALWGVKEVVKGWELPEYQELKL